MRTDVQYHPAKFQNSRPSNKGKHRKIRKVKGRMDISTHFIRSFRRCYLKRIFSKNCYIFRLHWERMICWVPQCPEKGCPGQWRLVLLPLRRSCDPGTPIVTQAIYNRRKYNDWNQNRIQTRLPRIRRNQYDAGFARERAIYTLLDLFNDCQSPGIRVTGKF